MRLYPDFNNHAFGNSVNFSGQESHRPSKSESARTPMDPSEESAQFYECVLLWDFQIVPAPPPTVVRPKATTGDELGEFLLPLGLEAPHMSNCFASNLRVCLVN